MTIAYSIALSVTCGNTMSEWTAHRVSAWTTRRAASAASRCRCRTGRATSMLRPARRGRLDGRRHRARPPGREGALGGRARRARRARSRRIVVTHFHPDHVGAARDLAELTGAPVAQGGVDYEQCELVWGGGGLGRRARRLVPPPRRAGRRHARADRAGIACGGRSSATSPIRELLEPGDHVDGWRAVAAPGHADGQLMLLRDGVLVAADHLLGTITPTVGLWPASRPDPLGDYLARPRGDDRARRAARAPGSRRADRRSVREGARAHRPPSRAARRRPQAALGTEPRSAYDVSLPLFGDDLKPSARRFAVAETLSHLERLVLEGGPGASRPTEALPILPRSSGRRAASQYPRPVRRARPPASSTPVAATSIRAR